MHVALARVPVIKLYPIFASSTGHLDFGSMVWFEVYLAFHLQSPTFPEFLKSICTNIMDHINHKLVTTPAATPPTSRHKQRTTSTQFRPAISHRRKFPLSKNHREAGIIEKIVASKTPRFHFEDAHKRAPLIISVIVRSTGPTNRGPLIAIHGLNGNTTSTKLHLITYALQRSAATVSKHNALKLVKFPSTLRTLPPSIIAFDDVAIAYSGRKEDHLYVHISFGIEADSRIAILGRNGTGKSTLLHLITGVLQPSVGTLPYYKSPIEYFQALFSQKLLEKDIMAWRAQLGRFALSGAHQTAPIKQLSDGLRNRVVFAQLAMEHSHMLLLDEPTNHLDTESIDALAQVINEFEGGVVIVSYDFRLISQVAEDLWEVAYKTIINLTKKDISIIDYKKKMIKQTNDAFDFLEDSHSGPQGRAHRRPAR
ncbi:hypothetical protein HYPSUDRAFT_203328 [Hypholoma sublateritium FD-334 SS-4]|uniref:ABC transporter domain-containing protein n=1 Tax=Hypholoma sublateritium (strain FD-334 SS-4) TaxID=945553 RepID=A0A0D2NQ92_HYPSF|nr:hypothetical protein HYPSUDRAFT_203328 [Hypholoma sublateritium FD-334 SS-4]